MPKLSQSGSYAPKEDYSWWGGLFFANEKKGWAVSDRWYTFRTEDGGTTWQVSNELGFTVTNLAFSGDKAGCVGGTSILCTEDSGKTWTERLGIKFGSRGVIEGFPINIQAISFGNLKEGWAVGGSGGSGSGDGEIMKTEDGGKSWRMQSRNYQSAIFVDSKIGWNTQYDTDIDKSLIGRTNDGGITWNIQKEFEHRADVRFFFVNPNTGWAVGEEWGKNFAGDAIINYFILHTNNGGKTWVAQLDEPAGKNDEIFDGLFDAYFINPSVGWVVGSKGRLYNTKYGGKNWILQKIGRFDLKEIKFIDEKRGWILGERFTESGATGVVLYTENGGKDWQVQWGKQAEWIWMFGIQFFDADTGWIAAGIEEYSGNCLIIHTTDGGKTWSEAVLKGIEPLALYFIDNNRGVILTEKNHICITHDGGKTWASEIRTIHQNPWKVIDTIK